MHELQNAGHPRSSDAPQQCGGSGSVDSVSFPWIRIRGFRIISLYPDPYQKLAGSGIRIRIQLNPWKTVNNFYLFTQIQTIILEK